MASGKDEAVETTGAEAISRLRGSSGSDALDTSPQLRAFFECWLDTFIFKGRIDPRLRELTILRVNLVHPVGGVGCPFRGRES